MAMIDIDVPRLDLVKASGFLEDIKKFYLEVRDRIVNENEAHKKDFQFIYCLNDDLVATYIAYYAFIFESIQKRNDLPEEQYSDVSLNIVTRDKYTATLDFTLNTVRGCISCLYEYYVGSDERTIEKYDEYCKQIQKFFTKRISVELFKMINYNPHFKQGAKLYYLHDRLDLDQVGVEDDSYEALEYYIYCGIHNKSNKEFLKHPLAFRRKIKSFSAEECRDRVRGMFDSLNESLYTLDDFYSVRRCKLSEANILVDYVDKIIKELKNSKEKVIIFTKKENNGN